MGTILMVRNQKISIVNWCSVPIVIKLWLGMEEESNYTVYIDILKLFN